jgi:AcrR family transcriptional regulator
MASEETGRPQPRPNVEDAILDAAERLFGARGPEGASLRQIAAEAGSGNNNAVQYHFKDKDNLVRAIFQRRFRSLEARRGLLMAQAVREGRERDPRTLLEILLAPMAEEKDAQGRCSYATFVLGLRVFSEFTRWRTYEDSPPISHEVDVLLRSSLAHIPETIFLERLDASVTAFVAGIVAWERRATQKSTPRASKDEVVATLLDFVVAGMTAAAPDG